MKKEFLVYCPDLKLITTPSPSDLHHYEPLYVAFHAFVGDSKPQAVAPASPQRQQGEAQYRPAADASPSHFIVCRESWKRGIEEEDLEDKWCWKEMVRFWVAYS
ncbi:hypothetical protein B0A55_09590 [Friedmanniomyces simplex]|uniref:Uncharacterized protein n=1 Tax=Friedmanniomyces simplex TaxID=329884 RepID=A0A4V5NDX3_9PEZI|nr:hypothetical protein B0A55_09590 [Friedmanniomyces simplex]